MNKCPRRPETTPRLTRRTPAPRPTLGWLLFWLAALFILPGAAVAAGGERVGLPAWTEVNAGVKWEIWKGLRVFGRWDNIFNADIVQAANMPGPRSSFLGGIGWTVEF